jgi:hypothetical protein
MTGRICVAVGLCVAAAIGTPAVAVSERAGAFPNLEPWPSSLALGGLTDALGSGIEAVLQNPTGMMDHPARGVAVSHASLFGGNLVDHQTAAFCWVRYEDKANWSGGRFTSAPDRAGSAYGIGVANLSGDLPDTNTYGELEISLAYARRVSFGVQGGMRLRVLQARSTVDGSGGGGTALDLGFSGEWSGLRVGCVARSVVSIVNWDRSLDEPLPRSYDIAIERSAGMGLDLIAGASLFGSWEPRRLGVAAQWSPPSLPISFRAGPSWRDFDEDPRSEFSAGVGLQAGAFRFDYGMRTGPEALGEIHRFALQLRFR